MTFACAYRWKPYYRYKETHAKYPGGPKMAQFFVRLDFIKY